MAEYWDLYDENKNLLGRTICFEIWIQNSKGQFLVTQRHPDKKAGGLWEFSGGGVLAGETTKQAAVRELAEELGICVEEKELKLLEVYRHKNYFMDIYVLKRDLEVKSLVLQPEEVVDAKWVSGEEVSKMIADKQVVWSVGLRYQQYGSKLI